MIGDGIGLIDADETVSPSIQHVLGIIETLGRSATKRLLKKLAQAVLERGLEQVGVDRRFALAIRRVAVTPIGKHIRSRRQLIERDRRGVALGMQVPTLVLSQR